MAEHCALIADSIVLCLVIRKLNLGGFEVVVDVCDVKEVFRCEILCVKYQGIVCLNLLIKAHIANVLVVIGKP